MGRGDAHGVHPGRLGRLDAERGVLEHNRTDRGNARLGRRDQEDLGVGLAPGDILQRRDRGESSVQAAFRHGQLEVRTDSAGADRQPHAARRQGVQDLTHAIGGEVDLRTRAVDPVQTHVRHGEVERLAAGQARGDQILDHLVLGIDGDRPAGQAGEIDTPSLSAEAQLESVMDEALAPQAIAQAMGSEQFDRAVLQHTGADGGLDLLARARLQDDRVDPPTVQEVREQQTCRSGTDDSDASAHDRRILSPPSMGARTDTSTPMWRSACAEHVPGTMVTISGSSRDRPREPESCSRTMLGPRAAPARRGHSGPLARRSTMIGSIRPPRAPALLQYTLLPLLAFFASLLAGVGARAHDGTHEHDRRAPKVMIVSMFGPEGQVWIDKLGLSKQIAVPGLSSDYPTIHCNDDDVCQMTTGMGHANVAASTMALVFSHRFDLRRTWFLIAGIAGIDPGRGTTGTAAWARYLVDYGISWEIDASEKPASWPSGYTGISTTGPDQKPSLDYRTEVFQLDETLLQKALALSNAVVLADSNDAQNYRSLYPDAPANQPPRVTQCDTAAGDTWWHGHVLGERATAWTRLLTDGKGIYCTTQQEDNATLNALTRASQAGFVDLKRVAVLRTASNFDRPHPGQTAFESLSATSGGFPIAIANLYNAGGPLVQDIVTRWHLWKSGVPVD